MGPALVCPSLLTARPDADRCCHQMPCPSGSASRWPTRSRAAVRGSCRSPPSDFTCWSGPLSSATRASGRRCGWRTLRLRRSRPSGSSSAGPARFAPYLSLVSRLIVFSFPWSWSWSDTRLSLSVLRAARYGSGCADGDRGGVGGARGLLHLEPRQPLPAPDQGGAGAVVTRRPSAALLLLPLCCRLVLASPEPRGSRGVPAGTQTRRLTPASARTTPPSPSPRPSESSAGSPRRPGGMV